MRERTIEHRLVEAVKKRGGIALKLDTLAGIPDRLILLPQGVVMFVETKAPGEKPRKIQEFRIRQLRELGFRVEVLDNGNEIDRLLKEH